MPNSLGHSSLRCCNAGSMQMQRRKQTSAASNHGKEDWPPALFFTLLLAPSISPINWGSVREKLSQATLFRRNSLPWPVRFAQRFPVAPCFREKLFCHERAENGPSSRLLPALRATATHLPSPPPWVLHPAQSLYSEQLVSGDGRQVGEEQERAMNQRAAGPQVLL